MHQSETQGHLLKMLASRGCSCETPPRGAKVFHATSKTGGRVAVFLYDTFALAPKKKAPKRRAKKSGQNRGNLRDVKKSVSENSYELAIVVSKKFLNKINYVNALSDGVQLFKEQELSFDPTSLSIVPEHELLSDAERNDFLKYWKVESMPAILPTDPMCKYFCGRPGDVFVARRPSLFGETTPYYRIVKDE